MVVVALRVLVQHASQVLLVEDEGPVEEFRAKRSDEPFADRVCAGCLRRSLDNSDAAGVENRVEAVHELRIAVAEQEPPRMHPGAQVHGEVTGLLGDPRAGRPARAPGGDQDQERPLREPARRTRLLNRDDHDIVATYGAEYRGIVQYYLLAGDVYRLGRLRWVMLTSLLMTLASKHRSTVTKLAAKHQAAKITTPYGPRTCLEAVVERAGRKPLVARFGGIPLKRQKTAVIDDRVPDRVTHPHKELVSRLVNGRRELCEQTGPMHVHHVRKLADLQPPGPAQPTWVKLMAQRRRKALVVCAACHDHIHTGQPTTTLTA
jgi:hypothetical protein